MMRAGARKYLLKDGDIEELTAAIRDAADSGNSRSPQ
jgi:DNA-binding NarL/FixJ family response regulator